jgi:hypothetical protein
MNLSAIIDRMIASGMPAGEAGSIAAEIYAAGVASASVRSPGAERTRRWRHKASQSVTQETNTETSPNVTERHEPSQSDTLPKVPISLSKNIKSRERQNRGTRLAADWSPSDADRAFAKQEGFSDFEIAREINKFRDHWISTAGAKGVKLDWSATWRKWIRNSAEWGGKAPLTGLNASAELSGSYYAKPDSAQLAAWDAYSLRTTGKNMPRDKNQGWRVKAEWPPELLDDQRQRA